MWSYHSKCEWNNFYFNLIVGLTAGANYGPKYAIFEVSNRTIVEYKQEILLTLLDGVLMSALAGLYFALLKEECKQRPARQTLADHAI